MSKKRLIQVIPFPRNGDLPSYGQKIIVSNCFKKPNFPRNFDFSAIWAKNDFFKVNINEF